MKKLKKYTLQYFYVKLIKQNGTPDSIARGVAVGLLVAFIIPIGPQMIVALGIAYLLKAKKIPAMAATWVTNYLTVPFLYPLQCYIGSLAMGSPLSLRHLNKILGDFFKNPSLDTFADLGDDIMIPFFIGGAIFGILSAFIGYFFSYGLILRHRQKKDQKLRIRLSTSIEKDQI
ncbi:MAG: hypothetical protein A2020_13155 [Lentisphaerae bacterium GWF2_45_14]|nr:MAG: hypothetical protein A2020_13155 [Lentisphaerae bacterium GWF2_45_14]